MNRGSYQRAAERLEALGRSDALPGGTLRVDMAETLLCYQMQPDSLFHRQLEAYLREREHPGCDTGAVEH